jgi:hypothetical protein
MYFSENNEKTAGRSGIISTAPCPLEIKKTAVNLQQDFLP